MKKFIITTLTCALIFSTQVGTASAKELNTNSTFSTIASYTSTNYNIPLGVTTTLYGYSYQITSGSQYANVSIRGNEISVTGIAKGTIVIKVYNNYGSLITANYITFI